MTFGKLGKFPDIATYEVAKQNTEATEFILNQYQDAFDAAHKRAMEIMEETMATGTKVGTSPIGKRMGYSRNLDMAEVYKRIHRKHSPELIDMTVRHKDVEQFYLFRIEYGKKGQFYDYTIPFSAVENTLDPTFLVTNLIDEFIDYQIKKFKKPTKETKPKISQKQRDLKKQWLLK